MRHTRSIEGHQWVEEEAETCSAINGAHIFDLVVRPSNVQLGCVLDQEDYLQVFNSLYRILVVTWQDAL